MKRNGSKYHYGLCHICGGRMEEQKVGQEFWVGRELVVVENVPAGVCVRCGERVVRAEVGRRLSEITSRSGRRRSSRVMRVPVISFPVGAR